MRRYHARTLHDRSLADAFATHYLRGLDLAPEAVVLNHGCGTGRHMGLLALLGFKSVGQDITSTAWWERLTGCGFQVVPRTLTLLPWRPESIDAVLDIYVLRYFGPTELDHLFSQMRTVLRAGGSWIIAEANPGSHGSHVFGPGTLPLDVVRALAARHGFEEVDHWFEGFYTRVFPRQIHFLRSMFAGLPFDIADSNSWAARRTRPEKRRLWVLRLRNRR